MADVTPLLLAGTSVGVSVISPAGEEPEYDIYGAGEFLGGFRGLFGQDGYYSFTGRFQAEVHRERLFTDQEYLLFKLGFGQYSVEAALLTTLYDDGSGSTYFNPSWKLRAGLAEFSDGKTLRVEYAGYVAGLPDSPEDYFYEGVHLVYRVDPSIFLGYELAAGGGWEYHYEQTDRHDIVLDIAGTIDGLAGYFTDWTVTAGFSWRGSNTTIAADSEDRMVATIDAEVFTSPHQSLTLEGTLSAAGSRYLSRTYGDGKLLFLETEASARAEWSPNQKTYLSLEAAFGYNLSNDPLLGGWHVKSLLTLTF